MAARMMDELAPLLAAEGIDLDDLDDGVALDEVNEALARATERHNLSLFTPVGAQRAGALAALRLLAESLAEGDEDRAAAVLAGIDSEPVGDAPAISHVIGASLGLLDTWHTDSGLHAALAATRVPRWNRAARAAATDVLALARKGRAFASLASLHRHGGLALFEGSALLVAASIIARAAGENAPVGEVARRMLADGEPGKTPAPNAPWTASPKAQESSFIRPNPQASARPQRPDTAGHPGGTVPVADRALQRGFGAWLEHAPSAAAPTVPDELRLMQALMDVARNNGLDLHRAADLEPLIDLLWDADDPETPEALDGALETLHDYVHFRLDAGDDPAGWEQAHEAVEDALDDSGAGPGLLEAMLERAEDVHPEVRRGALAQTPLITAVDELLEWVGPGKPVTQTGGVRRGDIGRLAGMLGIQAVGVAKRARSEHDEDAPIQALSMADVPLLAQWWEALSAADVIQINSSSVRRGPSAAEWTAEGLPPLELAEFVAGVFVSGMLTRPIRQGAFGALIVRESLLQLMRALAPEDIDLDIPESGNPGSGPVWTLRNLESAGLVTGATEADLTVPEGLRAAVARGLLLTVALHVETIEE
jgi:hypothetical protein